MDEENGTTNVVAEKLKYRETLFDLILLTNRSSDMADFKKNVDLIECLLAPYLDKQFHADKAEAIEDFKTELLKWGNTPVPESSFYSYEWDSVKAKYSALMKLAFRKKMLPQYELKVKEV